jgi:hypothetical protein
MMVVHHNNYYKPYPPLLTSFRGLDLGSTQQRALNRRSKAKTQLEITNLFLVVATFFDSQSIPTILEARAGDIQHGKTTPITHFLFNFIQKKLYPLFTTMSHSSIAFLHSHCHFSHAHTLYFYSIIFIFIFFQHFHSKNQLINY